MMIDETQQSVQSAPYGSEKNIEHSLIIKDLFDEDFYLATQPDVLVANADACMHYASNGWREGRRPNKWFDAEIYKIETGILELFGDPLLHYTIFNKDNLALTATKERLSDTEQTDAGELKCEIRVNAADYVPAGFIADLLSFDQEYYLTSNPDIVGADIEPYVHYSQYGWKEKRRPNCWFDPQDYVYLNPDVAQSGIEPLTHFATAGFKEGREFSISTRRILPPLDMLGSKTPTVEMPVSRTGATGDLKTSMKICVHVHLYYENQVASILRGLSNIRSEFKVIATYINRDVFDYFESILLKSDITATEVVGVRVDNRGRNIRPLMLILEQISDYDLCLHIHTKNSIERGESGLDWADHLYSHLFGDSGIVKSIIGLFEEDMHLGVAAPTPFPMLRNKHGWGSNRTMALLALEKLLGTRDVELPETKIEFPSGAMFWFRPGALKQFKTIDPVDEYFSVEPLPDDGTIAHALERLIFQISKINGFDAVYYERSRKNFTGQNKFRYKNPKVSVIIPVLNGRKYIHQALRSVITQTFDFNDIETIIVDNGSTDGTDDIARFYSQNFFNIFSFKAEGGGAGHARNYGLSKATGEYVMFLDADDVLAATAISDLLELAASADCDMVTSQLQMFDQVGTTGSLPYYLSLIDGSVINMSAYTSIGTDIPISPADLTNLRSLFSDFGPCAKIYKRRFVSDSNLQFAEGTNYEDNIFTYRSYLNSRKIGILPKCTYYYRKYNDAHQSQSKKRDFESMKAKIDAVYDIFQTCFNITNQTLMKVIQSNLMVRLNEAYEGIYLMENAQDLYEAVGNINRVMRSRAS